MAQAEINEGIALMTLQKLDEAKLALQTAIKLDPNSAQAWYNLGLAQHAGNELEPALDSFQHAVKLDPRDVDSWYFVGVCYGEMKQFDKAIETFHKALEVNPLHASAEFQLARALQRSGNTRGSQGTLQDLSASDQHQDFGGHRAGLWRAGALSTVTPIEEPETGRKPMIAMKLVARARSARPFPGFRVETWGTQICGGDGWRLHARRDRFGADGFGAHAIGGARD